MEIITTVKQMRKLIKEKKDQSIGFVPTMGFLHDGHLSLAKQARQQNDIVIMSIFVNPLQFGPNEDFDTYPRNQEHDLKQAKRVSVDYLFIPEVSEMYPQNMTIKMTMEQRVNVLCGQSRPGHFDGVITVLTKLFHIIQPQNVYFGLKDAQQFAVIESLISDLNFPVKLHGLPTVREEDGLALSSRNKYLSLDERRNAISLNKSLLLAQQLVVDGIKNPVTIVKEVKSYLNKYSKGVIDYVNVLNYPELKYVDEINEPVIIAVAVHYGTARLIDNIIVNDDGKEIKQFSLGGQ